MPPGAQFDITQVLTLLRGLWSDGELFALLHGDLLARNLVIDGGQVFFWEVLAIVDATVHLDVLLFGHLVLHLRIRRDSFYCLHLGQLWCSEPDAPDFRCDFSPEDCAGLWSA